MNYLNANNKTSFSFNYGGKPFGELMETAQKSTLCEEGNAYREHQVIYVLKDGLKIINIIKEYKLFNACEWVTYFENTSDADSLSISDLYDCDTSFNFEYDTPPKKPGYAIDKNSTKIYTTEGSNVAHDEFAAKQHYIRPGKIQKYTCMGGRSSYGLAPFFDVNQGGKGVLVAIGWTGQWQAIFERMDTQINIKTGIEGVDFKLHPKEKIRTSSVLILKYEDGQNNGHNQFRRLIKEHYSIIGQQSRPEKAPLSTMAWGGISTEKMLNRIEGITKHKLGFEYYWIDAGWYGKSTQACPDEFSGDWGMHPGDWVVNKNYHPDELLDVSKAVKEKGLKFLLWIEPERVIKTTPLPTQHPEWFFKEKNNDNTWLLNLGNEEALSDTIEMVSTYIEKLGIACYRQDFNIDPLIFWTENDEPERKGINEIKHVMGLYKFWDVLLQRFPNLIIDNCASGGRRIDIETLKRSIPLWRSDYQCVWNCDAETTQVQNTGISWWLPYTGTGAGIIMGDTYRIRSCYSAALATIYWGYEECDFSENQPLEWVKKQIEEYKSVRDYFSCDYYSLINHMIDETSWGEVCPSSIAATAGVDDTNWTAWQYDRPEQNDGIILAFRKCESPYPIMNVKLGGISQEKTYHFKDADTNEIFSYAGQDIMNNGFEIRINEKRSSKLYLYSAN